MNRTVGSLGILHPNIRYPIRTLFYDYFDSWNCVTGTQSKNLAIKKQSKSVPNTFRASFFPWVLSTPLHSVFLFEEEHNTGKRFHGADTDDDRRRPHHGSPSGWLWTALLAPSRGTTMKQHCHHSSCPLSLLFLIIVFFSIHQIHNFWKRLRSSVVCRLRTRLPKVTRSARQHASPFCRRNVSNDGKELLFAFFKGLYIQ
jgi:hypothetical protein